ncbi:MAG: hypothetical protein DHS20C01_22540 [marine bacterium B5-7]|nr:MAG: hypothetical protein DHS20C01_22540 [marine bacterium B5-7]
MSAKRLGFISMLGEPGTYSTWVYDDIGGDNECCWFKNTFGDLQDVEIICTRVSHGEPVLNPEDADCFILGGSYNSVHDDYSWQRELYVWFDKLHAVGKPLLAICGGHQLVSAYFGADVVYLNDPPMAGTQAVELTACGVESSLFSGIPPMPCFHFANYEHVLNPPANSTLLATHPRVTNAALSFENGWYSTQFHPEATVATLSRSWRDSYSELVGRYDDDDNGRQLIENFIYLAS